MHPSQISGKCTESRFGLGWLALDAFTLRYTVVLLTLALSGFDFYAGFLESLNRALVCLNCSISLSSSPSISWGDFFLCLSSVSSFTTSLGSSTGEGALCYSMAGNLSACLGTLGVTFGLSAGGCFAGNLSGCRSGFAGTGFLGSILQIDSCFCSRSSLNFLLHLLQATRFAYYSGCSAFSISFAGSATAFTAGLGISTSRFPLQTP